MSNGNLEHLWRAFIHDTDTAAKTKDASHSGMFANTTTCWLKVNIDDPAGKWSSTLEACTKSIGSNLVNTVDLIILAGDSEVSAAASADAVLGLGLGDEDDELGYANNEEDRAAARDSASLELRKHLLKACNLQSPTMYAALCHVTETYSVTCMQFA